MMAQLTSIDESCAFDCVEHAILIDKMKLYKFSEKTINWFMDYLKYRSQYVCIGAKNSRMRQIHMGVPQGSVLGTILYTIYINELPSLTNDDLCEHPQHIRNSSMLFGNKCLTCGEVPSYADDATVIAASNNRVENQEKLEKNMEKIQVFLQDNKLTMNPTKTTLVESMLPQKRWRTVGDPPKLETVSHTGVRKTIFAKDHTRVLGCNVAENLSWKSHLISGQKPLISSLRKTVGALKHLGDQLPANCKKLLATGLISSKLSYLISVWGGTTPNHMKKIQIVINSAARMITGLGRRTKISRLMEACNWLTVDEMATYHTTLAMWNTIWRKSPLEVHNRITIDNQFKLSTQPPRLQTTQANFRHRGVKIWNQLDLETRSQKKI